MPKEAVNVGAQVFRTGWRQKSLRETIDKQKANRSAITHHGKMDPVHAARNMALLEAQHPPDQFGGWFGTGRRRVERIVRSFGLDMIPVAGREAILRQIEQRNPVIMMLGMGGRKLLGVNLPSGHWMVAYGYDGRCVHFTNGWPMSWPEIEAGWRSLAAHWIRMNGRGLALRK